MSPRKRSEPEIAWRRRAGAASAKRSRDFAKHTPLWADKHCHEYTERTLLPADRTAYSGLARDLLWDVRGQSTWRLLHSVEPGCTPASGAAAWHPSPTLLVADSYTFRASDIRPIVPDDVRHRQQWTR